MLCGRNVLVFRRSTLKYLGMKCHVCNLFSTAQPKKKKRKKERKEGERKEKGRKERRKREREIAIKQM